MFSKILVPLDGSTLAERALAAARALVPDEGGDIYVIRVPLLETMVVPTAGVYGGYGLAWPDQALEYSRAESKKYLETVLSTASRPHIRLHAEVVEGDAASVILAAAAEKAADLIAMSTHGYSGLTRWVLGSVTERVLRGAACPVLALRTPQPIGHVLIPLDGSDLSAEAFAPGLAAASRLNAKVTLLRAVPPVAASYLERWDDFGQGLTERLKAELCEEAGAYLRGLAAEHAGRIPIETVVQLGAPADLIVDYAEAHAVDLVVMATHGHTGLRRWVYGSVTEKVLRGTGCSLLVVRPAEHRLH